MKSSATIADLLEAERLGGVIAERIGDLRRGAEGVQHVRMRLARFEVDGGGRRRGDQRHLGVAHVAVHRQRLVGGERADRHLHLGALDQLLQFGLGERRIAGGVLRDQLDLAAGDHAVALLEEERGAFLLLLAAGGERAGEHGEEADVERLGRLRERGRRRKNAQRRAGFEQRAARHSGFSGRLWHLLPPLRRSRRAGLARRYAGRRLHHSQTSGEEGGDQRRP